MTAIGGRGSLRLTMTPHPRPARRAARPELGHQHERRPAYDVAALRALLPLPPRATEVLDLTGRWCRERSPQRRLLGHGTHLRASRRGRTGHDATLLLVAGTPGFTTRRGEVWGAHVAWSGDHEHLVERLPEGAGLHAGVLGGGELLRPGEVRLGAGRDLRRAGGVLRLVRRRDGRAGRAGCTSICGPGPSHPRAPAAAGAQHLGGGLLRPRPGPDERARRHGRLGRRRAVRHRRRLVPRAARRHRRAGRLVRRRGPFGRDGLHPIVDHVRGLGMQVGLWVEPEMVNLDSDLVREHPSWLLDVDRRPGEAAPEWRRQHVLDVAQPEVSAYLLERLDALVRVRPRLPEVGPQPRPARGAAPDAAGGGVPGVHAQTLAVYRCWTSCAGAIRAWRSSPAASGGARVDLGILARTDRVWASDTNDAIERQQIQFWTANLLPPELVGSHVGPARSHTTGRVLDLPFRLATALFGHAGIEWDLTVVHARGAGPDPGLDRALPPAAAAAAHRRRGPRGRHRRGHRAARRGRPGPAARRSSAWPGRAPRRPPLPGRTPLPGLDPSATYRLELCPEVERSRVDRAGGAGRAGVAVGAADRQRRGRWSAAGLTHAGPATPGRRSSCV